MSSRPAARTPDGGQAPSRLTRRSLFGAGAAAALVGGTVWAVDGASHRAAPLSGAVDVPVRRYTELLYDIAAIDGLSPVLSSRFIAYGLLGLHVAVTGEDLTRRLTAPADLPRRPQRIDPSVAAAACLSTLLPALLYPPTPAAWAMLRNSLILRLEESAHNGQRPASVEYGMRLGSALAHWAAVDGTAGVARPPFSARSALGSWRPVSGALNDQALDPNIAVVARPMVVNVVDHPAESPHDFAISPASAYGRDLEEIHGLRRQLTPDQVDIARFWSDGRHETGSPSGHWALIALQEGSGPRVPLTLTLALTSMAAYDAALTCWAAKYTTQCARPETVIHDHVGDRSWAPLLATPPFPEHTSGHSTISGAAMTVLTALIGDNHQFRDQPRGSGGPYLPPSRTFPSFSAAAEEASTSRLYGGIHFRRACQTGLRQGAGVAEVVLRRFDL